MNLTNKLLKKKKDKLKYFEFLYISKLSKSKIELNSNIEKTYIEIKTTKLLIKCVKFMKKKSSC